MRTITPPSRDFLNRAKHQNFCVENERLHEIPERIGCLGLKRNRQHNVKHNFINRDIFCKALNVGTFPLTSKSVAFVGRPIGITLTYPIYTTEIF
jgi:hypothetical protein